MDKDTKIITVVIACFAIAISLVGFLVFLREMDLQEKELSFKKHCIEAKGEPTYVRYNQYASGGVWSCKFK